MSDDRITLALVDKLRAVAEASAMKARVVRSKKEARLLTRMDPTGHVWDVGDEYYLLRTVREDRPIARCPR